MIIVLVESDIILVYKIHKSKDYDITITPKHLPQLLHNNTCCSNNRQLWYLNNLACICFTQVFFSLLNADSPQPIYLSTFLVLYNTIFSASPIMIYALFEQNYSAKILLSKPELYKVHRNNWLMSWVTFAEWTALGYIWNWS